MRFMVDLCYMFDISTINPTIFRSCVRQLIHGAPLCCYFTRFGDNITPVVSEQTLLTLLIAVVIIHLLFGEQCSKFLVVDDCGGFSRLIL